MNCLIIFMLVGGGFIQVDKTDIVRVWPMESRPAQSLMEINGPKYAGRQELSETVEEVLHKIQSRKCNQ